MSNSLGYGLIASGLIVVIASASYALDPKWFYSGTFVIFAGALMLVVSTRKQKYRHVSHDSASLPRPKRFRHSRSTGGEHDAGANEADGDGGDGD